MLNSNNYLAQYQISATKCVLLKDWELDKMVDIFAEGMLTYFVGKSVNFDFMKIYSQRSN